MSGSVASHKSYGSKMSAAHSRSDGRSNHRSDRTSSRDAYPGIKFDFGTPDQITIYLKSMRNLADHVGTTMSKPMYKLVKKKIETTFPKPKAPAGRDPPKHLMDEY